MRFSDNSVNLKFIDASKGYGLDERIIFYWKAYIEKCDVEYKIEETQLPVLGATAGTTSIQTRFIPSVALEFNVFSEDRDEAIENYDQLLNFIHVMKPIYVGSTIGGGAAGPITYKLDEFKNIRPKVFFAFKGLPILLNDVYKDETGIPIIGLTIEDIPVQFASFNYSINKEMGFIQIPFDRLSEREKLFSSGNMRLVPIAFKITANLRIIAPYELLSNIEYTDTVPKERRILSRELKSAKQPFTLNPSKPSSAGKKREEAKADAAAKAAAKAAAEKEDASSKFVLNTFTTVGITATSLEDLTKKYASKLTSLNETSNATKLQELRAAIKTISFEPDDVQAIITTLKGAMNLAANDDQKKSRNLQELLVKSGKPPNAPILIKIGEIKKVLDK